jgi:phosphoribosylamine--glycine ligase
VVLPRLANDLGELCLASARGDALPDVRFVDDASVTVVLATEGYPADPRKGDPIAGIDAARAIEGVEVFHAGTARATDGTIVTAGGRVLAVTGVGPTIDAARAVAYSGAERISWPGMQYRSDIAAHATNP